MSSVVATVSEGIKVETTDDALAEGSVVLEFPGDDFPPEKDAFYAHAGSEVLFIYVGDIYEEALDWDFFPARQETVEGHKKADGDA